MLLPAGLLVSPYEILDYDATLVLHDPIGERATFQRTQRVKFLQDGVSGILDHSWGDGITLSRYQTDAGSLEDSFEDEGRKHLVIRLKRAMAWGETLKFRVRRTVVEGFLEKSCWVETLIDHPIRRLYRRVVFPKARACRRATWHHYSGYQVPLPIQRLASGKTCVSLDIPRPQANTSYLIRWHW